MKIGVISDTHGSQADIRQAVLAVGAVDLWLHAGDYSQDAFYIAELTGKKVVAVSGNCDGNSGAKIDEFIDADEKKVWLTHGHRYRAKERGGELAWWAEQYGADIVVYGHSHIPDITWDGNILLFNPGSTTYPRGGFPASCGKLEIVDGDVKPEIIYI